VNGVAGEVIRRIGEAGIPVAAIDVPTGLDGDTGQVRGTAFQAALTVTFFRAKPGHRLLPGRQLCGELAVADIGIGDDVLAEIAPSTFENGPAVWGARFPRLRLDAHKYARGHALAVSGGPANTGAARLAARAALRAGAGLVTVASPPNALAVNAAHLTAIMLKGFDGADGLARILEDKRKNACLIGPGAGVGQATRENVLAALLSGAAMLLDADALTSFAEIPRDLFVAIKGYFAGPVVLTPHEGEFARLFPGLQGGKLARARRRRRTGRGCRAQGRRYVIAAPEGAPCINAMRGPSCHGGSGDVLEALSSRSRTGRSGFERRRWRLASWRGRASLRAGLIAEDLPEMLPRADAATCFRASPEGRRDTRAPCP